jgi:enoyl-CoA hydratase
MGYEYTHLKVEKDEEILTITLNRPEVGNAVNGVMHTELARVFNEVRNDSARVVVLTGAGDSFCETGDMDWFAHIEREEWLVTVRQVRWIIKDMMTVEQPLLVKLNGRALGVGTSMALAGDLIYASERALLGDPHVLFGIATGDGAAAFLPNMVSLTKAKEMLFLGKDYSGQELFDLGIANAVLPHDQLDDAVDEVARQLASQPRDALRWTKMILNKWAESAIGSVFDMAVAYEGWSWESPEYKDALAAYVDRGK